MLEGDLTLIQNTDTPFYSLDIVLENVSDTSMQGLTMMGKFLTITVGFLEFYLAHFGSLKSGRDCMNHFLSLLLKALES